MPFQLRKPVFSSFFSTKFWVRSALFTLLGLFSCWAIVQLSGQRFTIASAMEGGQSSPDGIWTTLPPSDKEPGTESGNNNLANKPINVAAGRSFHSVRLQRNVLVQQLAKAPLENSKGKRPALSLPLPDGSFASFAIEDSPNMEPALAARYPEIKSYRAESLDHPGLIARLSWSPRGLHALMATPNKSYSLEPVTETLYASYDSDNAATPGKYECLTKQVDELQPERADQQSRDLSLANVGPTRRNYRLAVATTYEYTTNPTLGGGTKISALASVNDWINAVNLIYERDLSAHFNLVANNDQLIYTTSADPFTNGTASAMIEEIRAHLNTTIGAANYDVGHLLGVGGSGVAYVGVACLYDDYKGGGVSMIPSNVSVGNTFYIGRIAHELGHMFSAHHSFNDNSGNCAAQRSATRSYESGSGFTIMAYSGSCNAISFERALHFNGGALNQIADFMQTQATCATTSSTGNQPPTVNGGADRNIPKLTPFALTASANDPDSGDNARLTYSWEQADAGGADFGNPAFTDDGDPSTTTRPIFRAFSPTTSPVRLFPELFFIQDFNNEPPLQYASPLYTAQHLPRVTRNLNFKVIVRDQRGGVADDDVLLSVDGNSGPFAVTAPNTAVSWAGGSQQTVTWSVNNTNQAPVSCANVKISLSVDNGATFPFTLLGSTPNDGRETVTLPSGQSTTHARIKVEAADNIFFDMSDAAFTLLPGTPACPALTTMNPASGVSGSTVTLTGNNFSGVETVKFSNNVSASFSVVSNTQLTVIVPAGAIAGPLTISKSGCIDLQTTTFTPTACSFVLSSTSQSVGAGIQTASVNVTAAIGCAWTATSNASWITIGSGAAGNGNGTVNLSIAANSSVARTGTVTVAGQTFTVSQAGGCAIALSAASASVANAASTGSFTVTAGAGCAWTATSSDTSWLTITSGTSGSGNGTVNYSIAANTGASRSASITVADKTFTVTQAGGCTFALSATSTSVAATAGTGSFSITAGAGCAWTATSNQTWLTITSGTSGNGNGTVNYSVAANNDTSRTATITAGGKTFTVTQASGCTFTLSAATASVAAIANTGSFSVTAGTGCAWTATSSDTSWLTITSGTSGSGNGTVNYSIAANTGASRTATITAGGKTFTVTQASGCNIVLSVASLSAAATASPGNFTVTAGTGCTWTATSNQTWLTVTAGSIGNGNGTVSYSIAANTGASRTASITVGDKTFTVTQAAGCTFTLSATSASVAATASTGSFTMTAGTGCVWTAASGQTWLTITSGASGSGNGTVTYSVAANTDASRTATITAGGKTFTVTQASGCAYTISTTSSTMGANAASVTLTVTTSAGCAWAATSNASWLTVASGASGQGNGSVGITVAANAGPQRVGTMTIAGNTYTVTQTSGCAYVLNASSASAPSTAGTGSFTITAGAGCAWTATSNQAWLTITSGTSGSGNSTVAYSVAANTGPSRTASITLADKTFTVTQASGCAISLSAMSASVPATASTGSFNVTTGAGCVWTALSNQEWLTVTAGTSGNGNGTVNYSIAPNADATRVATITVGDKVFTVTQAGGCTITLNANNASAPVTASTGSFTVTAGLGCSWTATSNQAWLTITTGTSSSGNGTVAYNVAANTDASRTATITVGDKTFTVTQASGCTYALSTTSANVAATVSAGSFNVIAGAGCVWTATSDSSWLTISSGATGSGNGLVNYSVAANTGVSRTATISAAGKTFTVTQAGGCVYALSSTSTTVGANASNVLLAVTTNASCAWVATSNASWLTVASGASGSGNVAVSIDVAANAGVQRVGTVTIAGNTFTVTQNNGCTYVLSASGASLAATASAGSFTVTAGAGCAWTAISSDTSWLTVTSGASGNGNGTVAFAVTANVGATRTATITVNGATYTVTQSGSCTISLSATTASVLAAGATGSFNVAVGAGCAWTAISNQAWLTITSGTNGNGNGMVNYSVAANTGASRTATITVNGATYVVTQSGGCTISLSASAANVGAAAGTGSFNVIAGTGCTWAAASGQSWLTVTSGAGGSGNGTVSFAFAVNTGLARSATISVGGLAFTVTQAGGCTYSLSALSLNVAAAGTLSNFSVSAGAGCGWAAVSDQSWLTITSGVSGNGNGTVTFAVAANTRISRTGSISVGGLTFAVTQNGGCTITLSAANASAVAAGASGSFTVTAGAGCAWTAASNQAWLTITSGASGNGNGTVSYNVAANIGASRTATITVSDKTFTVTQSGGCTFVLSAANASAVAAGASGNFNVTAGNGCAWTATSNQTWLTIASGASGNGNGTVSFAVAPNTGPARSATILVADKAFTVTQAAGCSYAATISGQTFSSQASSGTVTVTATGGCAWTAASNQSWLAITTASTGVGNGTVSFSLAPNATGNLRQATLTVAGRSFVVSQDATCTVTLPGNAVSVGALASTGSASVSTNPLGCVFNAVSNAAWLTINSTSSSAVNYSVAANTGAARAGTLTIGDKTFTVNQAAAPANCTAYFTPDSHSASYAGGTYSVTVGTGLDCRWTATTPTPWIILDEATASGVRRGTLNYALATNTTTQARTGTIQVGQQIFTINQAAAPACTFSVSPGTMTAPANGGSMNFTVTASAGCSWASISADAAAAITAGNYGTGNGAVAVMTQPNVSGSTRTLRVLVAGQIINVTQPAGSTSNPLASLARTYPEAFTIGAARALTVYGRNFLPGSVVRWNGADRVTTYVSSTELIVTIPGTDLSADKIGTAKVSVFNPASSAGAGGGLSNALDFRVVRSSGNVQAASYGLNGDGTVAPETIMAGFGADLAAQIVIANTLPLPTTLGGTTVRIYDSAGRSFLAPLFFVSPTQVNYMIPPGLAPGTAELVITGNNGRMEMGTIQVSSVSPGLFTFNATGQGIVAGQALRVRNGVSTYESISNFDTMVNKMVPAAIDLGPASDQVFLILYGTGFRNRSDLRNVTCYIGGQTAGTGTEASVLYLGAQGGNAGLDQTNLLIPRSLIGSGTVKLWLKVDGKWANPVEVAIK